MFESCKAGASERRLGGPRCKRAVTHYTPLGPYCAYHALKLAEAACGDTILGLALRKRGIETGPVSEMLARWAARKRA